MKTIKGKNISSLIILYKISDKVLKIIAFEKFGNIKFLIETDDKLPDDITLKNVVILVASIINDGDKCYSQISSEEASYVSIKATLSINRSI